MVGKVHRVLVTGGTGSIGGAVIEVLKARGHSVTCLIRSSASEQQLQRAGYVTLRGDITEPERWLGAVTEFDAVIPLAITWADDMASVDARLTHLLIEALATPAAEKVLIYTSGCWVYGQTGDLVATENTPHCTSSEFAWGSELSKSVLRNKYIKGMVILPAMVYERDGGVLDTMISDALERKRIRVVGSTRTRWPMVHRTDLALLYALMLERGQQGSIYNGATTPGVRVADIAGALSDRYQLQHPPKVISVQEAVATIGSWAGGYSIDQQISGEKAMRELSWAPQYTDVLADIT